MTDLDLQCSLSEHIDQVMIGRMGFEMSLQNDENARREEASVIDGHQPDFLASVPTWLSAARKRTIHDIIPDEVTCIENFY